MAKINFMGYEHSISVNTTPSATTPTWEKMCLTMFEKAYNEEEVEDTTLCDEGNTSTTIVGFAKEISFEFNKFKTEDTNSGIEYLYSLFEEVHSRNGIQFKLTDPANPKDEIFFAGLTGVTYTAEAKGLSGVSGTLKFQGKPTFETRA